MTYNFDPDRWLADRKAALEHRFKAGDLDATTFASELAELERRYEELLVRLDGTFQMPARQGG